MRPKKKKQAKKKPRSKKAVEVVDLVEEKEIKTRLDWQRNQTSIGAAYFKLYVEEKKEPTYEALAKETGLSVKTIYRHEKAGSLEELRRKLEGVQHMMMGKFLTVVSASKSAQLWDLYFTLANKEYADWKRSKKLDVTSKGDKISESIDYSKLSTQTLIELADASKDTQDKSGQG